MSIYTGYTVLLLISSRHIKKADVFSLVMTIFEAGGGGLLPKDGHEWHSVGNNKLGELERYSADLNNLISEMANSDL